MKFLLTYLAFLLAYIGLAWWCGMDFATRGLLAPTIFICCVLLAFISAAIFTCLLEDALDGKRAIKSFKSKL